MEKKKKINWLLPWGVWHLAFPSWKKVGIKTLVCLERVMTRMHGFGKCLKWTPPSEKMHRIALPNLQRIKHSRFLISGEFRRILCSSTLYLFSDTEYSFWTYEWIFGLIALIFTLYAKRTTNWLLKNNTVDVKVKPPLHILYFFFLQQNNLKSLQAHLPYLRWYC